MGGGSEVVQEEEKDGLQKASAANTKLMAGFQFSASRNILGSFIWA